MCKDVAQLRERAGWAGANAESRKKLLTQLLTFISSDKIIDPKRLEILLNQSLQFQISQCKYHNSESTNISLMTDHLCTNNKLPSICVKTLTAHTDEVWGVHFSPDGKFLSTVSRDNIVFIWSIQRHEPDGKLEIHSIWKIKAHERPIYNFAWSNSAKYFATVSGDNSVKVWDNLTGKTLYAYNKHSDAVHACAFYDNDQKIISGGIDRQIIISKLDGSGMDTIKTVRVGDLKIDEKQRIMYIVEAAGNKIVIYDLQNKQEIGKIEEKENILSCEISNDRKFLLVNTSFKHPQIHLWDIESRQVIKRYNGHSQEKYYIKASFGGFGESFIASGSEDAQVYIWNRSTQSLVSNLNSHTSIVNCVAWSPVDNNLLVSGSDDYTVKIWDARDVKVEIFNDAINKEEKIEILQSGDSEEMEDENDD